jgi:hypothetical protein
MSADIKAFDTQVMEQALVWMQLFCTYHATHCMSVLLVVEVRWWNRALYCVATAAVAWW